MMFSIGKKHKGFTFVEVMVTLVILSSGIIFIYRSFFLCADYLTRLSMRLDANLVLDGKIGEIRRYCHDSGDLSFSRSGVMNLMEFNHRQVQFFYQTELTPVMGSEGLYQMDIQLNWEENGRQKHLSRLSMLEVG